LSTEVVSSGFAEEHELDSATEEIMKFSMDLYSEGSGATNFDDFWWSMPCE